MTSQTSLASLPGKCCLLNGGATWRIREGLIPLDPLVSARLVRMAKFFPMNNESLASHRLAGLMAS